MQIIELNKVRTEQERLQYEKERDEKLEHEKRMLEDPVFTEYVFGEEVSDIHKRLSDLTVQFKCKYCEDNFSAKDANYGNEYCCRACVGASLGEEKAKEYVANLHHLFKDLALKSSSLANVLSWLNHLESCDFTIDGADMAVLEHLRDLFECYDLKLDGRESDLPADLASVNSRDLAVHRAIKDFLEKEASFLRRMEPAKAARLSTHTCGGIYSQMVSKPWLRNLLAQDIDKLALDLESFPAAKTICLHGIFLGKDLKPAALVVFWSSFAKGRQNLKSFLPTESYETLSKLLLPLLDILKHKNWREEQSTTVTDDDLLNTANQVAVWMHDNAKSSADYEVAASIFTVLANSFSFARAEYYAEACQNRASESKRLELEAKRREEEERRREEEERRKAEEERREAERKARDQRELEMLEQQQKHRLYDHAVVDLLGSRNSKPYSEAIKVFRMLGDFRHAPDLLKHAITMERIFKHDEKSHSPALWLPSVVLLVVGGVLLVNGGIKDSFVQKWLGGGLLFLVFNVFVLAWFAPMALIRFRCKKEVGRAKLITISLALILGVVDVHVPRMFVSDINYTRKKKEEAEIERKEAALRQEHEERLEAKRKEEEQQQEARRKEEEERREAKRKADESKREAARAAAQEIEGFYQNGENAFFGRNGFSQNYSEAVKWYRMAAEHNHAGAQNALGRMYVDGQGITQNYFEALKLFVKAAGQGYAPAQNNLGVMYKCGYGVPQSDTEALKWFRKAADQNFGNAQVALGAMYCDGRGVPQSYAEALKWFHKAADQTNANAQVALGAMYCDGRGVPQNYAEALKWFHKAAEQNNADAQAGLGAMYCDGRGVPQNYAEALKWFRKAAGQGSAAGKIGLAFLREKGMEVSGGDAEEVETAQKDEKNAQIGKIVKIATMNLDNLRAFKYDYVIREFNALEREMTYPESRKALKVAIKRVECLKELKAFLIERSSAIPFASQKSQWRLKSATDHFLVIEFTNGKTERITWDKMTLKQTVPLISFYLDNEENVKTLKLRQHVDALRNAAIYYMTFAADNPSARMIAKKYISQVVEILPSKALEVNDLLPELKIGEDDGRK